MADVGLTTRDFYDAEGNKVSMRGVQTASGEWVPATVLLGDDAELLAALSVMQDDVKVIDQALDATSLNAAVVIALAGGRGEVSFGISQLTASGATLTVERCNNVGAAVPQWTSSMAVVGSTLSSTLTADGNYSVRTGSSMAIRLRVSTIGTGSIKVSSNTTVTNSLIKLAESLPAGSANIGNVAIGILDSTGGFCFPDRFDQNLTYNSDGTTNTVAFTDGVNTWTQTFTYTGGKVTRISRWVKS